MNKDIQSVWQQNAGEWVKAIEEGGIPSRRITNPAMVAKMLSYAVKNVCDLGCGEGWLTGALSKHGIKAVGVDGSEELIRQARIRHGGLFFRQNYESITSKGRLAGAPYEAVVMNFSCYEKAIVPLLNNLKANLKDQRLIFIQTLNPKVFAHCHGIIYQDQWIDDVWRGLEGNFQSTHRWFFRTMESWAQAFDRAGFNLRETEEPKDGSDGKPLSTIFTLQARSK